MAASTRRNSTNVRFARDGAAGAIGLALWAVFVAVLHGTGGLDRLHDDLPMVVLFACAVAALAYGVDAELRGAVQRQSTARLVVRLLCVVAAMPLHVALSVALAPAAVVLAAASLARAFEARFRTTVVASPGAKPGAP